MYQTNHVSAGSRYCLCRPLFRAVAAALWILLPAAGRADVVGFVGSRIFCTKAVGNV